MTHKQMEAFAPTRGVRIDWDAQPLGKVHDSALAERLGVKADTVRKQRRARGIARLPYDGLSPEVWDAQPLGQESDTKIAERLGVDRSTVRSARRRRGIPPAPGDKKGRRKVAIGQGHRTNQCEVAQEMDDTREGPGGVRIGGWYAWNGWTVVGPCDKPSEARALLAQETKVVVHHHKLRTVWKAREEGL